MRLGNLSDLSTRVRVREAAIELFGREGLDAPLRKIAADAGVTAGRIVQLFGSKDGLRRACDDHVFEFIRERKRDAMSRDAGPASLLAQLAEREQYLPLLAYVVRSLQAGGTHASEFIDHLVEDAVAYVTEAVAAGTLVPSRDEVARVRYLTEATLGHLALRLSLQAPQTAEELTEFFRDHLASTTLPALELYTDGLFTNRRMLDAYLLYIGDPPSRDQASPA